MGISDFTHAPILAMYGFRPDGWTVLTILASTATLGMILAAQNRTRHTTLGTAWAWGVVAAAAWLIAGLLQFINAGPSATVQAWHIAAVAALCPWIAVLGARRPGVRVWNWFVLLPLAAVLLWPVALCWMPRGPSRPLLEGPSLIGFLLVSVMGFGNYLGTRHTLSALLCAAAEVFVLYSLTIEEPSRTPMILRAVAASACALSVWMTFRSRTERQVSFSGPDRLLQDFRNTFGIVWANRLAERINAQAAKDDWTVRLGPRGFDAAGPDVTPDFTSDGPKIDHTLRWLLRRFVDEPWIEAKLKSVSEST